LYERENNTTATKGIVIAYGDMQAN
jgi:hypothetical protein